MKVHYESSDGPRWLWVNSVLMLHHTHSDICIVFVLGFLSAGQENIHDTRKNCRDDTFSTYKMKRLNWINLVLVSTQAAGDYSSQIVAFLPASLRYVLSDSI